MTPHDERNLPYIRETLSIIVVVVLFTGAITGTMSRIHREQIAIAYTKCGLTIGSYENEKFYFFDR